MERLKVKQAMLVKSWKSELDETDKTSQISWILAKTAIGKATETNKKCEKALLVKGIEHAIISKWEKNELYDTAH